MFSRKRSRIPIYSILLVVVVFVLGGCVTLLVVGQLLFDAMQQSLSIPGQEQIVIDDNIRPFPTSTAPVPPVTLTITPTPATMPRKIPLRQSETGFRKDEVQPTYELIEAKEIEGDVIADNLAEDEMMCVQHFNLSPTECVCWIGPLQNAGVSGVGMRGMRRIAILNGSAEAAALALINDWGKDLIAAGQREPCSTERLVVSYDGGLFKPESDLNRTEPVTTDVLSGTIPLPAIPPANQTSMPAPTNCVMEEVPPQLNEVEPVQANPGTEITVIGSGGYLQDNCGAYNESAKSFQLYFDGAPVGSLDCYVNHCQANLTIPDSVSPGSHCIAVNEGSECDIEIQVSSN